MTQRMTLGLALQALHERGLLADGAVTFLPGENGTIYHVETADQAVNVHPDGAIEVMPRPAPVGGNERERK